MYAAPEISALVRTRRTDMGISQTALSRLSGLSRATVNQVEKGTIKDLSLTRTAKLLEVLGLSLSFSPARPRQQPLVPKLTAIERATKSANVSYSRAMHPDMLKSAIRTGVATKDFEPHINSVLEDASVALLAEMVEEVHSSDALPHQLLWSNMRSLAMALHSRRELWAAA